MGEWFDHLATNYHRSLESATKSENWAMASMYGAKLEVINKVRERYRQECERAFYEAGE